MKWLIINDINMERKGIFFYLILMIGQKVLNVNLPIYFLNGIFCFYSIVIILYNDLSSNSSYYYTMFPRKRYFIIYQKNVTIVILCLFYSITRGIINSDSIQKIILMIVIYWSIGSLMLLFFCQFKVAYGVSTMQIIMYIIYAVFFWGANFLQKINITVFAILIILINTINIYFYQNKDFTSSLKKGW